MGAYDFVRTELEDMGARWEFWKVKQRPGKPLIFGKMNSMLLLGLPGNPVSSAVCFEIYVRPLLASMMGRTTIRRSLVPARLSRSMKKVKGLHYFARGITEETNHGLRVSDTGPQGSNLYTSMVKANCLIHMPEEMENPAEGVEVFVEPLDW
jgi:molybdopterin molybdotransferase